METKNNMICDLETGVCGPGGEARRQWNSSIFQHRKKRLNFIM